tara:strand:- start:11659 stop:12315 length:657 start_codon:yes stop_codon:yes gene_type:complete
MCSFYRQVALVFIGMILAYGISDALADVTSSGATSNQTANGSGSQTNIQGYEATTSNTYQSGSSSDTNNTTNNNNKTETAVNPANAPAMSIYSQSSCTIPLSAGVTVIGFSGSFGSYFLDPECEKRKKSELLFRYGMKVASINLLCTDPDVFYSMEQAGTVCPALGLIGKQAQEYWDKFPQLRPDYQAWLKRQRITKQKNVDTKSSMTWNENEKDNNN